jgi:hypothetical protein
MDSLVIIGVAATLLLLLSLTVSMSRRPPQTIYVIQTEETTDNGWGCLVLILVGLVALLLWR